jgi:hypothetical protein
MVEGEGGVGRIEHLITPPVVPSEGVPLTCVDFVCNFGTIPNQMKFREGTAVRQNLFFADQFLKLVQGVYFPLVLASEASDGTPIKSIKPGKFNVRHCIFMKKLI